MKRKFAWLIILALIVSLIPAATFAADEGEMLLTSEPVQGAVGDVVKVDFYCYPNLSDGEFLDSLEGTLVYDPEFLTLGSINLRDEEQNLNSILNSKSPLWIPSTAEAGKLVFAWADAFGTDETGFLFQIEFRIEKEGAAPFLFNSIRYHGINGSTYQSLGSYFINPVQLGGVYTEGYELTDGTEPDATYEALEPTVETPKPQATATPKPSNSGHSVPQTTSLPEPTNLPTSHPTGLVTPAPAVTSMPMSTHSGSPAPATPPAGDPTKTDAPSATAQPSEEATTETTDDPNNQTDQNAQTEQTSAPAPVVEASPEPDNGKTVQPTPAPQNTNTETEMNQALVIAVIAGIVVVILLAVLAIVLVLMHNKKQRERG